MEHFEEGPPEEFWKGFQQHMGYTDEEMEHFRNNPKKVNMVPVMASPKVRNSTLVFEVVKSHGCAEGMKVGDKLYFTGCGLLDLKRSSPWCAGALSHIAVFAYLCRSMILHGIDPNEMYPDHFSCLDCGSEYGWGHVITKAYVLEEDKK